MSEDEQLQSTDSAINPNAYQERYDERERLKDTKKLAKFEAKNGHRIANKSWSEIPFYRKRRYIFWPLPLAINLPELGVIYWTIIFILWLTGPIYLLKKFGADERVVEFKKSTLPIIAVAVIIFWICAFYELAGRN